MFYLIPAHAHMVQLKRQFFDDFVLARLPSALAFCRLFAARQATDVSKLKRTWSSDRT